MEILKDTGNDQCHEVDQTTERNRIVCQKSWALWGTKEHFVFIKPIAKFLATIGD